MTQDEIIEIAEASGAIVIKFKLQNDEATKYIFVKSNLAKFAELILASQSEPVACVTYKQVTANGATTTDTDLCITPYRPVNELGLDTELYTKPQPTSQEMDAMTETAKEASARAIADHNQIFKLNSALFEITKLNSRTTNYAVARKIACEALGVDDA